ncbi:MAG: Re/Si-specific NAD(P)(+) transhydrogenase subunit alpha [Bacteroidia bacterium]|nr:MAG: Re/Si-specific NAD(P)(+) transhydrogenase subunit alpha [Bacteroidia bacterium]
MTIGVLKETGNVTRVALLPEHVSVLTGLRVNVITESGSGHLSFFGDTLYSEAGALIKSRKEVINSSDVLLMVSAPDDSLLSAVKGSNKVIVGTMNPLAGKEVSERLKSAGLTTFSMDLIPRSSRAQAMDVLSSMATIAGYKAVLDAALHLPRFFPMFMSAAGTVKPAKVLILGAGVAGLQATATARKLGAIVEVFDVRAAVKEEVKSLGGKFIEVDGATEDKAAGGYAVEQTEDFKARQAQMIHDHAAKSDVIICTAQIPGKKAPLLIRKETVEAMLPGSVIIDLAASTGGNCEVTQDDKIVIHNQVTVIGQSDYPSMMTSDASKMYGTNLTNFLKLIIAEDGTMNLDFEDDIIKGTCLTHNGELVNERVKSILNI